MNGVVFHTSAKTTANRAGQVSPVQRIGFIPTQLSIWLAIPA